MQQTNLYPNVMIIPLPHPGHPAANLHPSDPRFVAAAQAGYAAYLPSVLQHPSSHQDSPSHMFMSASKSDRSERSALSPVDSNAKVHHQQGQGGKHEFRYPTTAYPFPPPRFAYSNSHGGAYCNGGQFAGSPMYAASLPGMGHVYAAQAAYQTKLMKNAEHERGVYASSSERTRREAESIGSSPRGEGYSSDCGAVEASSPIKRESGAGDLLEFSDRRASEGYRSRISSEGELRPTRADSTTSLPTPLPSLRALSELKISRPTLARTQSATLTIRELSGLPSRPRSSLGFATTNVGVSRGILDEMCTRRELPFPHPPSSPMAEREDMMFTPARGDSITRSRASDPPSMTRTADVADYSSSIIATDESDCEETDSPDVRGGSRRLNSFSARSNVTDEDDDRPTLRRLASLDYYAGTPARRSVSVGLGAVRMGAKKPLAFGRKLLEGKRTGSMMEDDENDEDEEVPVRDIKRSRLEESAQQGNTTFEEKIVPGARDEEAARLLLGLGMCGSV